MGISFSIGTFGSKESAILSGSNVAEAGRRSLAQLQQIVDGQANVLAYISAFFILGAVVALLIPLPFLMKRPTAEELAASHGIH